jgi:hypothetical protein
VEVKVMARRTRWLGAVGRAALVTAAVGAITTVAACGSRVAASQPAPAGGAGAASMPGGTAVAGVALCRHIPQLTSVVVRRATTLHVLEPAEVPPGITIGDPGPVRGLAGALCRLPAMPRGTGNCPAQFRDSLRLAFAAGRRPFSPVTVRVSGCRVVTGLGPARTASSAAFWRTLDRDLSLPSRQNTSQPGGSNP